MPDQNYIDNEWRPARSGATDDILNPATGAVIGTAPASEAADVDDAVTVSLNQPDDISPNTLATPIGVGDQQKGAEQQQRHHRKHSE